MLPGHVVALKKLSFISSGVELRQMQCGFYRIAMKKLAQSPPAAVYGDVDDLPPEESDEGETEQNLTLRVPSIGQALNVIGNLREQNENLIQENENLTKMNQEYEQYAPRINRLCVATLITAINICQKRRKQEGFLRVMLFNNN